MVVLYQAIQCNQSERCLELDRRSGLQRHGQGCHVGRDVGLAMNQCLHEEVISRRGCPHPRDLMLLVPPAPNNLVR